MDAAGSGAAGFGFEFVRNRFTCTQNAITHDAEYNAYCQSFAEGKLIPEIHDGQQN